ncbi:MAG: hypothetical protein VCC36_08065 [Gammaproteobacteria bacterium]|jgi:hypothetical protein
MKALQMTTVLAIFAGLPACGTTSWQGYAGALRPDDETALVRIEQSGDRLAATTQIVSIDSPRGDMIPVNTRSVRLLPGDVCVGVLATTSTMDQASAELCFYALTDNVYEIRVLVAGIEQDLVDSASVRRTFQRGPFRVTGLFMVDVSSSEIVAAKKIP